LVKDEGNSPKSEFLARDRLVSMVHDISAGGMLPVNELSDNSRTLRPEMKPILSGIKPVSWFRLRSSTVKFDSLEILGDIGPTNLSSQSSR